MCEHIKRKNHISAKCQAATNVILILALYANMSALMDITLMVKMTVRLQNQNLPIRGGHHLTTSLRPFHPTLPRHHVSIKSYLAFPPAAQFFPRVCPRITCPPTVYSPPIQCCPLRCWAVAVCSQCLSLQWMPWWRFLPARQSNWTLKVINCLWSPSARTDPWIWPPVVPPQGQMEGTGRVPTFIKMEAHPFMEHFSGTNNQTRLCIFWSRISVIVTNCSLGSICLAFVFILSFPIYVLFSLTTQRQWFPYDLYMFSVHWHIFFYWL